MTWTVAGYTAERVLGVGASGEVWAGRDDATREPVALKRLRPGCGDLDRDQLRREGALLAAFRHPNVVGLRGVLGTVEGLVLVLDLAAGGSLTDVLVRRGRLRSGQVVALFAPLGDALDAAHTAGLLHGDISPGNVLLDSVGTPLLADLGTSRLAGDDAAPTYGTSGYVDPAVRAGAAPTAASDVYSLAAVAAHALTGRALTETAGGAQRWADHAHALGVPAALAMAICAALSSHPQHRPSAAAFAQQLREVCPAEPLADLATTAARAADATEPDAQVLVASGPAGMVSVPGVVSGLGALGEPGALGEFGAVGEFGAAGVVAGPGAEALTRRVPRPTPEPRQTSPHRWRLRLPWRESPAAGCPPGHRPARDGRDASSRRWRPGRTAVRRVAVIASAIALAGVGGVAWGALDQPEEPAPPARQPARPVAEVASAGASAARPSSGAAPVAGQPARPSANVTSAGASTSRPVSGAVPASTVPPPASPRSAGGWSRVLTQLDLRRQQAFARADVRPLGDVYQAGSAPLAADRRSIEALSAARSVAVGVRHELRTIRIGGGNERNAQLEVTDRMPSYRIVDAHGVTTRTVPARGDRSFRIVLVRAAGGWRIATITEVPADR